MRTRLARTPGRAAAIVVAGLVALAWRPIGAAGPLTIAVGVAALLVPLEAERTTLVRWTATTAAGAGAFLLAAAHTTSVPEQFSSKGLPLLVAASIGEEAFFRRLFYDRLLTLGAWAAVGVTAVAFAAVHVPHDGIAVAPLDLAAGLVFGWERWASGSWTSPAATHVFANLVQLW